MELGPEDLRELVGGALAEVVAQVEALGGTVSAVSGTGLVALFGAPEAHEDDPERALRAAFRCVNATARPGGPLLRVGVETGEAIVGPIGGGSGAHYGAMGEVVGRGGAPGGRQPASVLVGPATRRATEDLFEWGTSPKRSCMPRAQPVLASCLERPKARPQPRRAGAVSLVLRRWLAGPRRCRRSVKLSGSDGGQRRGSGLGGRARAGKTRLVHECRKLFTAWVGAASGRLPLWLEGRAASYASTRPYGLYHQLLCAWLGVAPEESEEVTRRPGTSRKGDLCREAGRRPGQLARRR